MVCLMFVELKVPVYLNSAGNVLRKLSLTHRQRREKMPPFYIPGINILRYEVFFGEINLALLLVLFNLFLSIISSGYYSCSFCVSVKYIILICVLLLVFLAIN
ncbi:hypothetical protein DUQ00_04520 [Salmonella bongori]|nr:hypothetical protein [Salmonella bongori]ECC9595610.1 hypothetical protein [Salmonella bongori]